MKNAKVCDRHEIVFQQHDSQRDISQKCGVCGLPVQRVLNTLEETGQVEKMKRKA